MSSSVEMSPANSVIQSMSRNVLQCQGNSVRPSWKLYVIAQDPVVSATLHLPVMVIQDHLQAGEKLQVVQDLVTKAMEEKKDPPGADKEKHMDHLEVHRVEEVTLAVEDHHLLKVGAMEDLEEDAGKCQGSSVPQCKNNNVKMSQDSNVEQ